MAVTPSGSCCLLSVHAVAARGGRSQQQVVFPRGESTCPSFPAPPPLYLLLSLHNSSPPPSPCAYARPPYASGVKGTAKAELIAELISRGRKLHVTACRSSMAVMPNGSPRLLSRLLLSRSKLPGTVSSEWCAACCKHMAEAPHKLSVSSWVNALYALVRLKHAPNRWVCRGALQQQLLLI
jgi:hypothetical protein